MLVDLVIALLFICSAEYTDRCWSCFMKIVTRKIHQYSICDSYGLVVNMKLLYSIVNRVGLVTQNM